MIITNGMQLILPLDFKDGNNRFRVAEVVSLVVKVFTIDKNKFIKFDIDDISQTEDVDEIYVPEMYMNALDSGVIQYQYIYSFDGRIKKIGTTATDFYWKNVSPKSLPFDDENGVSAVSKTTFEKFKSETDFNIESINDRINEIADIASTHVDEEDNSVIYEYETMTPINELYIDEVEDNGAEIYWKDEVDSLIQQTKDYADEKVEELATSIDGKYAKKEDIPDVSEFITEHQDLSEYQKTVDADEKYQPKGDYLTEHQDISNLATKAELEALTPDLSDYYTKAQCDATFLSEHQSLKDYLTESDADRMYASKEYVDEKVSDALDIDLTPYIGKAEVNSMLNDYAKKTEIPDVSKFLTQHQDLSDYALKSEIPAEVDLSPYALKEDIPTDYITKHQSLADYAKKSEIPSVPTKLSQLANDCGFITQEINLSDYVALGYLHKKYYDKYDSDARYLIKEECADKYYTKDEVDAIAINKKDLNDYALKSDLKALSDAFENHTDVFDTFALKDAVYTKSEVDKKVSDVDVTDKLNDYAKKTDIPDVSNFLTQHQSLSNYYTKDQADVRFLTHHQSLEDYVKKERLFNQFYTKDQIDAKKYLTEHQSLNGYATETWVESQGYIKEHQSLDGLATEEWVENKKYLTEHQSLDDYYTKNDVYDKTDVDALVHHLEHKFEHYYDKLETENLIRVFIQNVREPDLGAYLKINDADSKYVNKEAIKAYLTCQDADAKFITSESLRPYLTCQDADKKFITKEYLKGYVTNSDANERFLTQDSLRGYVTYKEGDKRYLTEHSLCDYWTAEETLEAILQARLPSVEGTDGLDLSIYLKKGEASKLYQPKGEYVSKEYVDEEIAKIDTTIEMTEITESEIRNLL